jgi:dihydrolipoamide dehydrogenase
VDATHVAIAKMELSKQLKQKNIIIATGSKPANLPFIKIDKERIIID